MENVIDIEKVKQEYIKIFRNNIKREGSDELLKYLESSDFFTAPASTKFHSAFNGGLCLHSINVFNRFVSLLENEYGENWQDFISLESATICGLLHDVCKVNFYIQEFRNVKIDGEWTKQPFFMANDTLPYGHGEKSVYIISGFMKLTREEAMAINWHMGGFDMRVKGGSYTIENAFRMFPNAFLFHIADLEATYLDETK